MVSSPSSGETRAAASAAAESRYADPARVAALVSFVALAVTACATYEPRPLAPAQTRATLEARSLLDPDVTAALATLLPRAQAEPSPAGWGRVELLVAASVLNPALAEARAHIAEAAAAVETAREIPNPTVGLGSEYDVSQAAESPWLWSVSTNMLLETALVRRLRTDIASAGVRAARLEYAESLWSARRDVRASLLGVLLAQKRIALLTEATRDRERLSTLVTERVAAGEAAPTDRLQADLERTRGQSALAEARREEEDARAQLAALIGVPRAVLDAVELRWDGLDDPPVPAADALASLREQALLSRPDLERAVVDYESRELELRLQVRAQYPQLSVGPGYTWDHGIRKATLGLSFALPVFNRNEGPIAEAEARRATAGEHLVAVQAQVLNEIDAACTSYARALDTLRRTEEQQAAAQTIAVTTERAVALGAEDTPTLLTARLGAGTEALARLDALGRAQSALGQLEDALRTPLEGEESTLGLTQESTTP